MWLIRAEHLHRTTRFFQKHGGRAVVLARFVPIVRTFAPFVAGAGQMSYRTFTAYNVVGAVAWVGICTLAGYAFGRIPIVRDNFSLVALGIVAVSLTPMVWEVARAKILARRAAAAAPAEEPTAAR